MSAIKLLHTLALCFALPMLHAIELGKQAAFAKQVDPAKRPHHFVLNSYPLEWQFSEKVAYTQLAEWVNSNLSETIDLTWSVSAVPLLSITLYDNKSLQYGYLVIYHEWQDSTGSRHKLSVDKVDELLYRLNARGVLGERIGQGRHVQPAKPPSLKPTLPKQATPQDSNGAQPTKSPDTGKPIDAKPTPTKP